MAAVPDTPEGFFAGDALGLAVLERVTAACRGLGPLELRVSRSQIGLRRTRGFAYLWRPGQYLRTPAATVVLSIALGRHDSSPRFKEVAHPSPRQWMHHLEIRAPEDIDEEVVGWLREAADRAE